MNKKLLIIILVVVVLVLVGGVLYYWETRTQKSSAEQAVNDAQETVDSINENLGESLFGTTTANPLENVPDVNPYKNTNPFSDIKTNPFK